MATRPVSPDSLSLLFRWSPEVRGSGVKGNEGDTDKKEKGVPGFTHGRTEMGKGIKDKGPPGGQGGRVPVVPEVWTLYFCLVLVRVSSRRGTVRRDVGRVVG